MDLKLGATIETTHETDANFFLNGTFDARVYQLFFDFEMTGLHKDTTPISLGISSDTGKTFYAEFDDFDKNQVDEWIAENVIGNCKFIGMIVEPFYDVAEHSVVIYGNKEAVRAALLEWLGNNFANQQTIDGEVTSEIQFIGDCCAYDWLLMTDLIAEYQEEPLIKDLLLLDMNGLSPEMNFRNHDHLRKYLQNTGSSYIQSTLRKVGLPLYPCNIRYIPLDICTMLADRGMDPDMNREELALSHSNLGDEAKHNAMWDAEIIKSNYYILKSMDVRLMYEKLGDTLGYKLLATGQYENSRGEIFELALNPVSESAS